MIGITTYSIVIIVIDRIHLYKALRLLCLLSLTCGGIKSNKYDQVSLIFDEVYGYLDSKINDSDIWIPTPFHSDES